MKHYFLTAKDVGDLTRVLCAGLEEVEAKAHLIVVAEKEAFKVRAMAMAEALGIEA